MQDGYHGMDAHPGLLRSTPTQRRAGGHPAVCRVLFTSRPPHRRLAVFLRTGCYGVRPPPPKFLPDLHSRGSAFSCRMFLPGIGRVASTNTVPVYRVVQQSFHAESPLHDRIAPCRDQMVSTGWLAGGRWPRHLVVMCGARRNGINRAGAPRAAPGPAFSSRSPPNFCPP